MLFMLDVALPEDEDSPILVRSFAACLASAAEVPVQQLLGGDKDLEDAIARWRSWLAGRGAGIVPIANPAKFNWPGYWIGVLTTSPSAEAATTRRLAVLMCGTPAGVVLSPQDDDLLGRASRDLPVTNGYLLASLNPALGDTPARVQLQGTVEAIALAEVATGPVRLVDQALALAGRGLAGDRYAAKAGTFTASRQGGRGYDLTLIQSEALDNLELPDGERLSFADARRNIVTSGIDLNALVGRRFRIGDVECLGQRLCEPCAHLERLSSKGVLRGLIHRGGLRADVLSDGLVRVGAAVQTID
jgi:MOSC domain-containing protein YiiM